MTRLFCAVLHGILLKLGGPANPAAKHKKAISDPIKREKAYGSVSLDHQQISM